MFIMLLFICLFPRLKVMAVENDTGAKIVGNPEAICETADTPTLLQTKIEEAIEREKSIQKAKSIEPEGQEIVLCSDSSVKTYMDGSKITNRSSAAYQTIKTTTISDDGFYKQGEYYAVALGNYYGPVGTKYRITLSSGKQFYAIKSDTKSDADTYNRCTHISDGSMIEFIVDVATIKRVYPKVSLYGNFNVLEQFNGNVVKIEKIIEGE